MEAAGHTLLTTLGLDPLDWRNQIVGVLAGGRARARTAMAGLPAPWPKSPADLRYGVPLAGTVRRSPN